jgi:hypothetical protein
VEHDRTAFGVYFCVIKLEHLLLGRKFVIETDHANLLYMNIAKAPKVVRWRLRLQEFDFEIRHIAGKLNIVADGLSRLLAMRAARNHHNVSAGRAPPRPIALRDSLPFGWTETISVQKSGKGAGKSTKVYHDADRNKFSSADACWKAMHRRGLTAAPFPDAPASGGSRSGFSNDHHSANQSHNGHDWFRGITRQQHLPANITDQAIPDDVYAFDMTSEAGRLQALQHVHSDIAGHLRVVETYRRLRDNKWTWAGCASQVKDFIHACPTCQKTDVNRQVPARDQRPWCPPSRPGDILAIDLIGPVGDIVPTVKGAPKAPKTYILVMVDIFSRHLELEVITSKKPEGVATALLRYVMRYGLPSYLRSDGGGEFTAAIIDDLLTFCGTERQLTLPYLSRANGVVERTNKEVMRHVRGFVMDRKDRSGWANYLPLVQRIVNSVKNKSTGFTPHQIMFGSDSTLDRGILMSAKHAAKISAPVGPSSSTDSDAVLRRKEAAAFVARADADRTQIRKSAATINKNEEARRHRLPAVGTASSFESGDYVLMSYPKDAKPKGKIGPTWRGPYEILRRKDATVAGRPSNTYFVKHCASGKEMLVSDSTLVDYDPKAQDPRITASVDNDEWVVDRIVDHAFNPPLPANHGPGTVSAKNRLELRCRWLGYGPAEDEWISYRGNKDLEAVSTYSDLHPELRLG